ncbi:MAG: VOC family protein, partial [Pseudonocardia sp.]|nr:VOC family protein [Pseudonocardia sp.]
MTIELNHTIVHAHDPGAASAFLASILGIEVGARTGPFLPVALTNDVTLDYLRVDGPLTSQHYAFLVDDATFDAAFARITAGGIPYWADSGRNQPGVLNSMHGG